MTNLQNELEQAKNTIRNYEINVESQLAKVLNEYICSLEVKPSHIYIQYTPIHELGSLGVKYGCFNIEVMF